MSQNGCQYNDWTHPVEAQMVAAATLSAVGHNHRRLPGVLRYRGLENEAVAVARLVKVESLVATLTSVLDDLDALMGVGVSHGGGAERETDNQEDDASRPDAHRIGLKHAQLVERVLATALSKIHAGVESVGGHPVFEDGQGIDAHARGTKRDMNAKSGEERPA